MNSIRRNATTFIATLLVSAAALLPASGQAEDRFAPVDDYSAGDFGRVVHHENGLRIERSFVDPGMPPGEEVGINAPVFPGDTVITDGAQRVEIQVAGGSVIRSDRNTEAIFVSLPDPYAEFADHAVIQLSRGSLRISTRLAEGEELRIDTPSASIYLLADGDFRVDVAAGGRTEVISRGGVAEVVGDGGSILLRGGMRTEVFPGTLPEDAWAFNTFVTDNFDRWVDERAFALGTGDFLAAGASPSPEVYASLPEEVRPYYGELEQHGEWAYVEDYGQVWQPTTGESGWSPYHNGYWSSGPGGWFWVSYEPWGWAPYHYGRWNWVSGYGWCWSPGRVFAGAWVAWSWGSVHVGWAPLNYWGRPAYVEVTHLGYYDPGVWTFVDYNHVARRDYQRYAVRVDDIRDDLRQATVVGRSPRVPPDRLARSTETREFARRVARADRASWLSPIERGGERGAGLREVEREMLSRRGKPATRTRSNERSGGGGRAASRTATGRPTRPTDGGRPVNRRQTDARSTRRATVPIGSTRTSPGVSSRVSGRGTMRRQSGGQASETDERVRDLYRNVTTPDRSTRPSRSRSDRTGGSPRSQPRPQAPTTREQSRGPSRSGSLRSRTPSPSPTRSRVNQPPRAGTRPSSRAGSDVRRRTPSVTPPPSRPAPSRSPARSVRPSGPSRAAPGRARPSRPTPTPRTPRSQPRPQAPTTREQSRGPSRSGSLRSRTPSPSPTRSRVNQPPRAGTRPSSRAGSDVRRRTPSVTPPPSRPAPSRSPARSVRPSGPSRAAPGRARPSRPTPTPRTPPSRGSGKRSGKKR